MTGCRDPVNPQQLDDSVASSLLRIID